MINPRIILEKLVARLEAKIGKVTLADLNESDESSNRHRYSTGRLSHVEALRLARSALRKGNEPEITLAAQVAPMLEREGNKLADARRQSVASGNRKAGGVTRGAHLAEDADREWAPWVAEYNDRIARGQKHTVARQAVIASMTRAEFVLSATRKFPSDRTIRERLPRPKNMEVS